MFFFGIVLGFISNYTHRYVGAIGVIVSLIAFISLVIINKNSMLPLKRLMSTGNTVEKIIFKLVYWFTKATPLFFGLLLTYAVFGDGELSRKSLTEINVKVEEIT